MPYRSPADTPRPDESASVSPSPLVIAHRGANVSLPEHSLAAYAKAIDDGADGLECDVRLTRDGHLVLHHDRSISRTSDGSGPLADHTLAQLRQFDFGVNRPGATGDDQRRITTLVELLDLTGDAGRPVRLFIETKHPSRFGPGVEESLHRVLREYPHLDVTVMSFARAALTRYRALDPKVPLVWLFEYPLGRPPAEAGILGPRLEYVSDDPRLVLTAAADGRQVYVWTINTEADAVAMRDLGVQGLITDDPALVRRALGRDVSLLRHAAGQSHGRPVRYRAESSASGQTARPEVTPVGPTPSVAGPSEGLMRLHTLQGVVSWQRRVPHHARSASMVRRWLSEAVSDIGNSGLRDLHAVATELVCNAVRHAAALPGGFLRVFCQRDLTVVEFAVTDGRSTTRPMLRRLDASAPDGRGLHIVSALATDWGFRDDDEGRTVWARLSVDESGLLEHGGRDRGADRHHLGCVGEQATQKQEHTH